MLAVTATFAIVILITTPELAALSFLFDPVLLDVALLFFGTQLLLFHGQRRSFFAVTRANIMRCFKPIGSRRRISEPA
ncbi:hypothetical protein PY254_07910 [Rhodanobacter sp. AS-Z3]|uniref:hypothetical protein n=1 Tax=Rhodanobacter sp. AS-Z3 TaxID=3031330 RepID=UPI00247B2BD4|nr:hypothetical protein [Rhodanobacter sp. AS-Z3]WEN16578.1 hypothetical protein PY254_07910 [Rhodanobacter sp. AS-Z3]